MSNNRNLKKRITALLEMIQAALPGTKISIAWPNKDCGFSIEAKMNDGQQLKLNYSPEEIKATRNKTITKSFVDSVNAFKYGITEKVNH